jgi:hypothetical protein
MQNDLDIMESVTGERAIACQSDVVVWVTTEYDKFNFSELNRDPSHYKNILESIKENDLTRFQPILVDDNLTIVDGQNRFLACRELGLPINFIISKEVHINDAGDINQGSKPWNSKNFVEHYSKRGRSEYIRILDICHKYDQSISVVMQFGQLKNGLKTHAQAVKKGVFKFREDIDVDEFFEHMKTFNKYYHFAKKDRFVKAVFKLYTHENYDKKRMEKRLRTSSGIVNEQPNMELMVNELLKLYNYKSKKPVKF